MRVYRSLLGPHAWSLLLGLTLSAGLPTGAHAARPDAAAKQSARRTPFRSPYSSGLKKLDDGPLVTLMGSYQHVDANQYKDLSTAVRTLLKKYPADKHYFIGTGRDPAPIIAALEVIGGRQMAMNFPASNVVGSTNITPALLKKYFARLIPDRAMREDILSGRRKLVLLDQSNSGKTPNSLAPYFQTFFDAIGSKAKMVKLAFSPNAGTVQQGVEVITTEHMPDVATYLYQPYEGIVSQYPRHVLGTNSIDELVERDEYRQFKKAVGERMKRDKGLHDFLMKEGGPAFRSESAAEVKARLADEARKAAAIRENAAALPGIMKKELRKLVGALPERTEGHDKGPYLSESAEQLNGWLAQALGDFGEAAKVAPELKRGGTNQVVSIFMDEVERARAADKIRNRDYRRLMGHAIGAAKMDAEMVEGLVTRFKTSKYFAREVTTESKYYLEGPKKEREETANMPAHFKVLVKALPASARAAMKAAKDEQEDDQEEAE